MTGLIIFAGIIIVPALLALVYWYLDSCPKCGGKLRDVPGHNLIECTKCKYQQKV